MPDIMSSDSADRVPTVPDSARQCPTEPDRARQSRQSRQPGLNKFKGGEYRISISGRRLASPRT
eukprot:5879142-Prymnesium_polylepis.3